MQFLILTISKSKSKTFNSMKMSDDNGTSDEIISDNTKFWVYLIFLIPSIICSLLFIIYIIYNRTVRHAVHNHVITVVLLIGLFYQVTLYPWMLYSYHYQGIWSRSLLFCTLWEFIDWGVYFTQTILVAWASIERHILVFHDRWVATKWKRFFVHYLSLITLFTYCLSFYIIVGFFPPCENLINDSNMACTDFCFAEIYGLYMWDLIFHQTLPNLIIFVFSIALIVRVLYRKYRIHRAIHWRKNRKMIIQLLSIASLYLIFAFPMTLMNLLYQFGLSYDTGVELYEYLLFFNYVMLLFLPMICLLSLPELHNKIKRFLHLQWHRQIGPSTR